MTISNQSVLHASLERAVRGLSGVLALPGVPTLDWCQLAARSLSAAFPGSVVVVRLLDQTPASGAWVAVNEGAYDSFRAAGLDPGDLSFEGESVAGWWLTSEAASSDAPAGEPCFSPVERVRGFERWGGSGLFRGWAEKGVPEVILGSLVTAADADRGARRLIVVELGQNGAVSEDSDILGSLLPELAKRVALAFGAEPFAGPDPITDREHEVLDLLVRGLNVREIAEELSRSPHTVHDHVKSLHRKLHAACRGELVARALGRCDEPARNGKCETPLGFAK